jgi:hypothetical protein
MAQNKAYRMLAALLTVDFSATGWTMCIMIVRRLSWVTEMSLLLQNIVHCHADYTEMGA